MAAFSVTESFSNGWEIAKKHWFKLFVLAMVSGAVGNMGGRKESQEITGMLIVLGLLGFILSLIFSVALTDVTLRITKGKEVAWGKVFEGVTLKRVGNLFLGSILVGITVLIGMILLIIPGFIAALSFSQVTNLIVDKDMDAISAMKESWRIMQGNRVTYFGFMLLAVLIIIVSLIPFGLGLLVSVPLVVVTQVLIYRQVAKAAGEPVAQESAMGTV